MICVGDLVCRSFLPKSLSKVQARYLEPARRPMTPSEYEQAQQAERQRAEKGGSKRATGGGRAGGDEGEGRFAVASMQDPFGLGESRDEKKEEAEGGKDAATVKTKVRREGRVRIGVNERKGLSDCLAWLDVEGKRWEELAHGINGPEPDVCDGSGGRGQRRRRGRWKTSRSMTT
jgi:hypothetical protein